MVYEPVLSYEAWLGIQIDNDVDLEVLECCCQTLVAEKVLATVCSSLESHFLR